MSAWVQRARWCALVSSLGLYACSSDEEGDLTPRTLEVGDARVTPGDDGGIAISVGDRDLIQLASQGPIARRFGWSYSGATALFTFERTGEEAVQLEYDTGHAAREDSGVVIPLRAASGFGGEGALAGAVHFSEERLGTTRVRVEVAASYDSLALPLVCTPESSFYGFGGQYNAIDQRGEVFDLFVREQGIGRDPQKPYGFLNGGPHTTYFPMPYFVDARGFGVYWRTDRRSLLDLCRSEPDVAWIEVESGEPLDLLLLHGPTMPRVVEALSEEVGRPKAPPAWAYDLWVGAQGGRDAVLAEVAAIESAGIPAGAFWVQDWTGIRQNLDGGFGVNYRWTADEELYPDLPGMISGLHDQGYRFLSYANPFVPKNLNHFAEMDAQGLLIHKQDGTTYTPIAPNGTASMPDLTNEAAREYVKRYLRQMVRDGHDGWMADFGEWLPLDAVLADGSDPVKAHNRYPVEWHRLWREVMDEERPDGDFAVFGRSGYAGVQQVSQIHWIGDQECDFKPTDGLPTVVPAMLNLGLSGVPYVTHDIAGFSGGPSTKELFMRWTELGAFTPIMRTHEGAKKLENWSWEKDAETTAHFRRFVLIHQALRPEFERLASESEATSLPSIRALVM
ncbi:MAG: hypothetical protein KC766_16555, partial [Myxococcales bacterium]|nr:hypothetical protein [Myxococcales bacterium]